MTVIRGSDKYYRTTAVNETIVDNETSLCLKITFVRKMKTDYRMRCTYIHVSVYRLDRVTTVHLVGNSTCNGERDL